VVLVTVLLMGILFLNSLVLAGTIDNMKTFGNSPPEKSTVTGPWFGKVKAGEPYKCKIIALDPDDDNVSYQVDWDDGEISDWTEWFQSGLEITQSHIYNEKGNFLIKARAKDVYGQIGPWGVIHFGVTHDSQKSSYNPKSLNPLILGKSGISLVTVKVIEDMKDCGWYSCNVPFTINYESDEVSSIYYSYNSGEWTDYTGPFEISEEGKNNYLEWHTFNHEGNISEIDGPFYFSIDKSSPEIEEVQWEAYKEGGIWYALFTCYAVDEDSGMDRVEMYINGVFYELQEHNGPSYEFTVEVDTLEYGDELTWIHFDKVGNWEIDDISWYIESYFISSEMFEKDRSQFNKNIPSIGNIEEIQQYDCSLKEDFPISSLVVVVDREMGKNNWSVSDVIIDLIPDNDISEILYKLDSSDWTPYTESIVISEGGDHEFLWYVTDLEGHSSIPDFISFNIDQTPPEISVDWETYKYDGRWYADFICDVYDKESDIDRVEMWINDGIYAEIPDGGPGTDYVFTLEWGKAIKKAVFKFVAYNDAGLSAIVVVNGSDIKSSPSSQYFNSPPDAPRITGPIHGKVGVNYEFTFRAVDPDDDNVSYLIKWGDDHQTDWVGPFYSGDEIILNHTWDDIRYYRIEAKVKDIYGAESEWSTTLIPISKSNDVSFMNWLYRFPFIQMVFEFFENIQILKNNP